MSKPHGDPTGPEDARLTAEFERLTAGTAAALELRLAQVVVGTGSVALLVLAIASFAGARVLPTAWATTLVFMAWYGATWWLVWKRRYQPWMRWVATTIDTSLATFLFVTDAWGDGPLRAFVGTGPVIYFLAVVGSTLRLDPRLGLYAGAFGALQFLLAAHLVVLPLVPEDRRSAPEFAPWLIWLRVALVLGAGFMARAAGRRMRRLLSKITWDAVERESLRGRFGEHVVESLLEPGTELPPEPVPEPAAEPLPEPAVGSPKNDAPAPVLTGARTLFVAGLADFSRVASGQRPEEAAAVRAQFVELVLQAAKAEGGRVDRFLSDGVLAVFDGAGDAARALRASRRLLASSSGILGAKNRVAIGLDRAQVVPGAAGGEAASTLMDTLNVAGRLRDACGKRQRAVLATRAVCDAAGADGAGLEDLGWLEVPGLRELVPVRAIGNG